MALLRQLCLVLVVGSCYYLPLLVGIFSYGGKFMSLRIANMEVYNYALFFTIGLHISVLVDICLEKIDMQQSANTSSYASISEQHWRLQICLAALILNIILLCVGSSLSAVFVVCSLNFQAMIIYSGCIGYLSAVHNELVSLHRNIILISSSYFFIGTVLSTLAMYYGGYAYILILAVVSASLLIAAICMQIIARTISNYTNSWSTVTYLSGSVSSLCVALVIVVVIMRMTMSLRTLIAQYLLQSIIAFAVLSLHGQRLRTEVSDLRVSICFEPDY
jgi:hypothetical protein